MATSFAYDMEHLCKGLHHILTYLSSGNSVADLESVQNRARIWCREYFGSDHYERQSLGLVSHAHPHLLRFSVPSWLRLLPDVSWLDRLHRIPRHSNFTPQESEGDRDDDEGTVPFPSYSEPVLLEDGEIFQLFELYEILYPEHEPQDWDRYLDLRAPLNIDHLRESPIVFYIPEVMCHLARLDPEAILQDPPFLTPFFAGNRQPGRRIYSPTPPPDRKRSRSNSSEEVDSSTSKRQRERLRP